MVFGKKKDNKSEEMQNWYQDRYSSVAIQRNFLLVFSVFTSLALLICLIVVKNLQEGKASEPYLIEYDKQSGLMTIVETKSKQEYTAQQAVKESMMLQYISHRESPKLSTVEEDMNYVRVSTSAKIYTQYLEEVGNLVKDLRNAGTTSKYEISINSIQYFSENRVQVTITKKLINNGKEINSLDYKITVAFQFANLELPIDDMRINPLGFQVTYYKAVPVKVFKSALIDAQKTNNEQEDDKNSN